MDLFFFFSRIGRVEKNCSTTKDLMIEIPYKLKKFVLLKVCNKNTSEKSWNITVKSFRNYILCPNFQKILTPYNVGFMSCSKCSNWCQILKLLSNIGCLSIFCYLEWANKIKTDFHICNLWNGQFVSSKSVI